MMRALEQWPCHRERWPNCANARSVAWGNSHTGTRMSSAVLMGKPILGSRSGPREGGEGLYVVGLGEKIKGANAFELPTVLF